MRKRPCRLYSRRYSKYLIRADGVVVYPYVGNLSFFFAAFIRLAIQAKKSFRTDQDARGGRWWRSD